MGVKERMAARKKAGFGSTFYGENGILKGYNDFFNSPGSVDMVKFNDFAEYNPEAAQLFGNAGLTFDSDNKSSFSPTKGLGAMDYVSGGAAIAGGLGDLANAYLGYKNYKLAKDQFGFEKAATNRNIFNEGTLINTQLANANNVGLGLAGNTMTEAQKQASRDKTAAGFVDTSAIG